MAIPSRTDWPFAALALLGVLFAAGCSSLPQAVTDAARVQRESLEAADSLIEEQRGAYSSALASSKYASLETYAERENLLSRFDAATRELAQAREIFARELEPLLEQNRPEDEARAREALAHVGAAAKAMRAELAAPLARLEQLATARDHGASVAEQLLAELERGSADVSQRRALVQRASADYPEKAEDLAGRVAAIRSSRERADASLATARQQLAAGQGGDIAVLADSLADARAALAAERTTAEDLEKRAAELYVSYAKTLVDMKERYAVVIGRTSWNDFYDFPSEHEARYPAREVSEESLTLLDNWGDGPIYRGRSPRIDAKAWRDLGLDPKQGLPRGDNAIELWIADISETYFHRYEIVEGDQRRQGEWEEVSAELYEAHYEDLGMDIIAKPFGMYEEEALRHAMPPGLAFVGNKKYGRWEDDGRGGRRWSWFESYLFYRLMFGGGHYYHYNRWNGWYGGYRGRRGYYGAGSDPAYGTRGSRTRNSSRYSGSEFGRRGGFRRADATFRGSGPGGRGGGPGGGGK